MKLTEVPNPERRARPQIMGLEPWQIEALERLRARWGLDADAIVRAGLTLALSIIAAQSEDDR